MNPALHLKIAGLLLLALAAAHGYFPRRFAWRAELARLSLINRQIFIVHCLFIVLVLILMGLLSLVYTATLIQPTPLARPVLAGLTLFWLVRLLAQFFIYDPSLWRGNRANTIVHVLATLLWLYFVLVFGWTWWRQMRPG